MWKKIDKIISVEVIVTENCIPARYASPLHKHVTMLMTV